jgi:hypothetical protein
MSRSIYYANGEEVKIGDTVEYEHTHGHKLSQFSKGVAVVLYTSSGSITLRKHKSSPSFQYFVDFNYGSGRYETDCNTSVWCGAFRERKTRKMERIGTLSPEERKQFIQQRFKN